MIKKLKNKLLCPLSRDSLKLFNISDWIFTFARNTISVFIPIFMLNLGFSVQEVLVFYIIFNVFDLGFNLLAGPLIKKIGARKIIALGSLAYILFFLAMSGLSHGNWVLVVLMAFLYAMHDAFYWIGSMYFFVRCSPNDDNVSGDASRLSILRETACLVAPLLGGLILIFLPQRALIATSIGITAASLFPLFMIKEVRDRPSGKVMKFSEFFSSWKHAKDYVLVSIISIHRVAHWIIWPIFVFMLFKSMESIAILPIIIAATRIAASFFTGRIKKSHRTAAIIAGSLLNAAVWIVRMFFDNAVFYYVSAGLMGVFTIMIMIPLDSTIMENGERRDALRTAQYRNTFSMTPRIFYYALLLVLVGVFQVSFITAALSAMIVAAILSIGIVRKNGKAIAA